jgi:hypothetical protein
VFTIGDFAHLGRVPVRMLRPRGELRGMLRLRRAQPADDRWVTEMQVSVTLPV